MCCACPQVVAIAGCAELCKLCMLLCSTNGLTPMPRNLPVTRHLPCRLLAAGHLPLYALNKLPYGKLAGAKIGVKEGVMFLTYSSLTSSSGAPLPASSRCSPG